LVKEVQQGEIYWLDFGAAEGSTPSGRRPCVVVQSDLFNQTRLATTLVCVITSNAARAEAPGNVAIRSGEGNLRRASVVNVSQIATVDKSDLVEYVGKLPARTMDAIHEGLQLLLERG
jgi:mRNA interferase MazF